MVFLAQPTLAADKPSAAAPKPATTRATRRVAGARRPDRSIVYKHTDARDLSLEVFNPPGWAAKGRRPCVVLFFGGGFARGEPSQFFATADYLSGRGLVVICPDYRQWKNAKATSERAVEDARSAMRWIRSHVDDLGIDAERIVAGGGSAGGFLAAAVAWGRGPDAAGEDTSISTRPMALVLYNPAFGDFAVTTPAGGDEQQLRRQMLPLTSPPANGPPAILFYGTDDKWLQRSEPTLSKLRASGYPAETWLAPGQTHGFFNRPGWHQVTLKQTDVFLARLGLLKGDPTIVVPPDPSLVLRPSVAATSPSRHGR
jgi:acetyl esterase/lipase